MNSRLTPDEVMEIRQSSLALALMQCMIKENCVGCGFCFNFVPFFFVGLV